MAQYKAIRVAYGEALAELGAQNEDVVVLDADLSHATMTCLFAEKFPERFFDIGIAEQNMINIAAGLSTMGYIPFVSSFAIFCTGRAYEQIRNSIAYNKLNVKIGATHAGITLGEDGGSHQAFEDLALMRVIPGMTIIVPSDANETVKAVKAASELKGPVYLRLARLPSIVFDKEYPFEIGKANVLKEGQDLVIFACGIMVDEAIEAALELEKQGINAAVVNVHTIKPIDSETVLRYANTCKNIITVEEHSSIGGLGDAIADVLIGKGDFRFKKIGINDRFGQSGKPLDLLNEYGLTAKNIAKQSLELLNQDNS